MGNHILNPILIRMVKTTKDKKHDKEAKGSGKSSRKNSQEVTELL